MISRREKLERLLEKSPDDPFLHFGLAMECVKEGRIVEALAGFDRTVELDPHYTAAFHHRGQTLIAAGRIDEARDILRRGVAAAQECGNEHARSEMQELVDGLG